MRRAFLLAAVLGLTSRAHAEEPVVAKGATPSPVTERTELSVATEPLLTAFSLVAGEPGGHLTVGLGRGHLQLRAVGLAYTAPKFLVGNSAFDRDRIRGGGLAGDVFLGRHLDGLWLSVAIEGLAHTVRHEASGTEASWANVVTGLSVGYLWRLHPGFFVSPRAGVTLAFHPHEQTIAGDHFKQAALAPEFSLRVGWYFGL